MEYNHLKISGIIIEVSELSCTPGGVPFRYFVLEHRSRQLEAGTPREVFCRLRVDLRGETLRAEMNQLRVAQRVSIEGFLARSGYKNDAATHLVLHATSLIFLQG